MPIFEFHCPSCQRDFEELVPSAADARKVPCPECGAKGAQRKLSIFAAHAAAGASCPLPGGPCGQACDGSGGCELMRHR